MGLTARLIAGDYWGKPDTPPFTFDVTSGAALRAARRAGALNNLVPLVELPDSADNGADFIPLVLAWRNSYPTDWNAKSAWGGGTYLAAIPGAFGGTVNALAHERTEADTIGTYTGSFTIPENGATCLRLFAYKPPKDTAFPVLAVQRGGWQFQLADGQPEIAKLSAAWTQDAEDDLNALRAADGYDTLINSTRAEIYEIYQSLSGGVSLKNGEFFDVVLLPEPAGVLNIWVDGEHTRLEVPSILATRKAGKVLTASTVTVRANGGAFMWQVGAPVFAESGTVDYTYFYPGNAANLGAMTSSLIVSLLDGTDVEAENLVDTGDNDYAATGTIRVTASTTDTRFTPFLYSAQANLVAGERATIAADEWDSDTYALAGHSIFEEVEMNCEADMWRRAYNLSILDLDGAMLGAARNYAALENRIGTLSIGGTTVLTNGLIRAAERDNMTGATPNQTAGQVADGATRARLTLCDAWAILDEDLMRDTPIGDGLKLGAYIRLILQNAGFSTAELAGISETYGRKLPIAAPGEAPCVRPTLNQSRSDFLRELVEHWGMGAYLYQNFAGVWNLAAPSDTVVAAFARDASYASRLKILAPLDFLRDYTDFYNDFMVIGATDARGVSLCQTWTDWSSILYSATTANQNFIGRVKKYPTVQDDGLRTPDDVAYVLRSLRTRYNVSGRFVAFESFLRLDLAPGMTITVDGLKCRLARISGGSVANDRASYVAMELVQTTGS